MRKRMFIAMLLAPVAASAHPSLYQHTHTFVTGLAHPFTGFDHLLAMISVGLWASQRGGRAFWLWPAAFVGGMIAGGTLGMEGTGFPMIEPVIAASLIVLGVMIAAAASLPVWMGAVLIAVFGLFHGNAHGLEAPLSGASLLYGLGFTLSTVSLHALGLGLGMAFRRIHAQPLLRVAAALVAVAGGALLLA